MSNTFATLSKGDVGVTIGFTNLVITKDKNLRSDGDSSEAISELIRIEKSFGDFAEAISSRTFYQKCPGTFASSSQNAP
jgi:hypothetical protein